MKNNGQTLQRLFLLIPLTILLLGLKAQTVILSEDFNACAQPSDWSAEILLGNDNWQFGMINNSKSNDDSMDGTCMAYFDDDGIGSAADPTAIVLSSPLFSGTDYERYYLSLDLIYRIYVTAEDLKIFVHSGAEKILLENFSDDVGGPHFNDFVNMSYDLSPYRAAQMKISFEYQDGADHNWWMGIDNFIISAEGSINDACARALPIVAFQNCTQANTAYALFTGSPTQCGTEDEGSLWYSYNSTFTGILKIETQSNFNDIITFYQGTCGNITELHCHDRDEHGFTGEALYVDVVEGQDYTIRISGKRSTFGESRGDLCLKVARSLNYPSVPTNDNFAQFQALSIGQNCQSLNNLNANFDQPIPSRNERTRSDIWYAFSHTEDGNFTIDTETDFAEVISIYTHDGTNYIENQVEEKGEAFQFMVTKDLQYYIQVAGFFATLEGDACVEIFPTENILVDNTDCINATLITLGDDCLASANIGASYSGIKPSCDVYPQSDIWFSFIAPDSEGIRLFADIDFVHNLAIYEGDCVTLEEVYCNNHHNACAGSLAIEHLEAGETYYLQVSATDTYFDQLQGNVCVKFEDINTANTTTPINVLVSTDCQMDGSVTLNILTTGGTGNYTYYGNSSGETLYHGEHYTVIVMDDQGCQEFITGTIDCPGNVCTLVAQLDTSNEGCLGDEAATASILASAGVPPYSYEWSTGAVTASIDKLAPGEYSATLTDANNCPIYYDFTIDALALLIYDFDVISESSFQANNGQVWVHSAGGSGPYTYNWNHGPTDAYLDNMVAGTYTVIITDANSCSVEAQVVIPAYNCTVSAVVTTIPISCYDLIDGSLTAIAVQGTGPYNYIWDDGSMTATIDNLGPGNYTVTVTDAQNCSFIITGTVPVPDQLALNIVSVQAISCNGANDGYLLVEGSGTGNNYSISWGDGFIGGERSDLGPGVYDITVVDDLTNCMRTTSLTITEPDVLAIASYNETNISCNGLTDGSAYVMVIGGTESYSYLWDDGQILATAENLSVGNHSVTVTDDHGCQTIQMVTILEPNALLITLTDINNDIAGTGVGGINAMITGGTGAYNYTWYLDGVVFSMDQNLTNANAGNYQLEVTDANGCMLSSEIITLSNTSSTEETLIEEIRLSPNPASQYCELRLPESFDTDVSFNILNSRGQVLAKSYKEIAAHTYQFNLEQYLSGFYIIEIINQEQRYYKKLVVGR